MTIVALLARGTSSRGGVGRGGASAARGQPLQPRRVAAQGSRTRIRPLNLEVVFERDHYCRAA